MEQKEQDNLELMIEEINCVLRRNKNEKFLRTILTRALIIEELTSE